MTFQVKKSQISRKIHRYPVKYCKKDIDTKLNTPLSGKNFEAIKVEKGIAHLLPFRKNEKKRLKKQKNVVHFHMRQFQKSSKMPENSC